MKMSSPRSRLASLVLTAALVLAPLACSTPSSEEPPAAPDEGGIGERDASRDIGMTDPYTPSPKPEKDASRDIPPPPPGGWNPWDHPTVWRELPALEPCEVYEADLSEYDFPKREWSSCGVGCEVASAQYPIDLDTRQVTSRPALAGTSIGGEVYLRLNVGAPGRGTIHEIVRLPENETIAAIKLRNAGSVRCGMTGYGYDAALLFPLGVSTGNGQSETWDARTAWVDQRTATLIWDKQWLAVSSLPRGVIPWEEGWGMVLEDGTLRVVESPEATKMTILASGVSGSFHSAARGDLIVAAYRNGVGQRVIGGYSRAKGWRELIANKDIAIRHVTMSDDYIVWVGLHGPPPAVGSVSGAEFYWSPIANTPEEIIVTKGPSIHAQDGLDQIKAGGDYAATMGCRLGEHDTLCELFVVRLSTKQLWVLPRRPGGNAYMQLLAVSQDEIVYGENDRPLLGPAYNQLVQRLVRLKTAELDAIQAAWVGE